jgi:hypothetical protein
MCVGQPLRQICPTIAPSHAACVARQLQAPTLRTATLLMLNCCMMQPASGHKGSLHAVVMFARPEAITRCQ